MKAGPLDRRVTILRRTMGQDAFGAAVETYAPIGTVYAARELPRLTEIERQGGAAARVEAKFLIRFRTDLDLTMRLQCGSITYEIIGIEEIGRRAALAVYARGAA